MNYNWPFGFYQNAYLNKASYRGSMTIFPRVGGHFEIPFVINSSEFYEASLNKKERPIGLSDNKFEAIGDKNGERYYYHLKSEVPEVLKGEIYWVKYKYFGESTEELTNSFQNYQMEFS